MIRILIIDDEENTRLLYKEEFQEDGYQVAVAATPEEAMEKIRRHRPDIITLDIKMPGSDGFEFMRKLAETESDISMVLCTRYAGFNHDFRVWSADGFVIKSADLTELKTVIRQILADKHADLAHA